MNGDERKKTTILKSSRKNRSCGDGKETKDGIKDKFERLKM